MREVMSTVGSSQRCLHSAGPRRWMPAKIPTLPLFNCAPLRPTYGIRPFGYATNHLEYRELQHR